MNCNNTFVDAFRYLFVLFLTYLLMQYQALGVMVETG